MLIAPCALRILCCPGGLRPSQSHNAQRGEVSEKRLVHLLISTNKTEAKVKKQPKTSNVQKPPITYYYNLLQLLIDLPCGKTTGNLMQ